MDNPTSKKTAEEIKEERRRERWKAFLTPWIVLGSLVGSVAFIMALLKHCSDRLPQIP